MRVCMYGLHGSANCITSMYNLYVCMTLYYVLSMVDGYDLYVFFNLYDLHVSSCMYVCIYEYVCVYVCMFIFMKHMCSV